MSTKYLHSGQLLEFIAPSGGVTVDVPVLIQNVVVVPIESKAQTLAFQGRVEGVISNVLKASGAAWTTGQVLYFDTADATFKTAQSGTARRAAIAAAPALSADTTGTIKLLNVAAAVNVA